MFFYVVFGYIDYNNISFGKGVGYIGEIDGFFGVVGGVIFGVEI